VHCYSTTISDDVSVSIVIPSDQYSLTNSLIKTGSETVPLIVAPVVKQLVHSTGVELFVSDTLLFVVIATLVTMFSNLLMPLRFLPEISPT